MCVELELPCLVFPELLILFTYLGLKFLLVSVELELLRLLF